MTSPLHAPAQGHPSLSLALWAGQWLAGRAGVDAVLDGMAGWADVHQFRAADDAAAAATGLPGPDDDPAPGVVAALTMLRRFGAGVRTELVLPAPGDVAGTVAGTAHAAAAIEAGETVVFHLPVPGTAVCADCVGLVPEYTQAEVLTWTAFSTGCPGRAGTGADPSAGHRLRTAVRQAADVTEKLARRSAAGVDARRAVAAAIEDADLHPIPSAVPHRAAELLGTAATVAAIVAVAAEHADDGPPAATGQAVRHEALIDLARAVRRARIDAVATAVGLPAAHPGPAPADPVVVEQRNRHP